MKKLLAKIDFIELLWKTILAIPFVCIFAFALAYAMPLSIIKSILQVVGIITLVPSLGMFAIAIAA